MSALDDLRSAVNAGQTPDVSLVAAATLELYAIVVPAPAAASDPVAILAESITTDRPVLTGS